MSVAGGGGAGGAAGVCRNPAIVAISISARIAGVYCASTIGDASAADPPSIRYGGQGIIMHRLFCITLVTFLLSPAPHAVELTVAGAWTINRHLTQMPLENERPVPEGGRRATSAGGGGGRGGRGGFPSFPGGWDTKEEEQRKTEVIRRRLTEIPDRLIISTTAKEVTITDGLGRSYSLKTDGKKQERVTGDGEFTSKTRFEGASLVVLDDFGGPQVITTYTPTLEGGEIIRLTVTLKADRLPDAARNKLERRIGEGGGDPVKRTFMRIYDAEAK